MKARQYKTFAPRFGAALIDSIFFVPLYLFLEEITGPVLLWEIFTDILWCAYSIGFHGKYGQTLGKMIMKIKVVEHLNEENYIGYKKAALREIGGIILIVIDYILRSCINSEDNYLITSILLSGGWIFIELFSMLFNSKGRAIHDFIAGSIVKKCDK